MDDFIEFLFRLGEIKLKEQEIQRLETTINQAHGTTQLLLETQKQELELIKLTRGINILTLVLVVIGLIQIIIMLATLMK